MLTLKDRAALMTHHKAAYVAKDWRDFVQQAGVYDFDVGEYVVEGAARSIRDAVF